MITCEHCMEEMNEADWGGNGCRCTACGLTPAWKPATLRKRVVTVRRKREVIVGREHWQRLIASLTAQCGQMSHAAK